MKRQVFTLPWPPKILSPNAPHGSWTHKASAKKGYKLACAWTLAEQKAKKMKAGKIHATMTFHPPDARRRDLDNMLASSKYAIDAVSEAVGVDDSKFSLTLVRGEPRPKQGAILIELEAA